MRQLLVGARPAVRGGLACLAAVLVTAASLPILWRIMRPEGLRTE